MFDALNTTLDEAIASAEADIRNNPVNQRRRQQAKPLFENHQQEVE